MGSQPGGGGSLAAPHSCNYGLGGWVCGLGPPRILIIVAWVGGHRAIVEKNFTLQSVHGPSGAISNPLIRLSMLQLNDPGSIPAINNLCHLPWSGYATPHATPRHTTPHHTAPCHATPCHATPCHFTPHHATLHHTTHHTTHHTVPRYAAPHHSTACPSQPNPNP